MKTAARRQWLTLVLLTAAFALNFMDRQVINILAQPIKTDLHISDTALSFLAGTAFTLVYAFAAIPIARIADRFDRVTVVASAIAFWSVMTGLCGVALGYLPLLLFRLGVGLGEAGGIPASHSMISDHFTPKRRALAMGVYAFGLPGGTLLGLMVGGVVYQLVGWRWTFVIAAAPGLLLALVIRSLLRELPRGHSEADGPAFESVSLGQTMAALSRNLPYWVVTLGCGAALLYVYVANAWFPAMLIRLHHMPVLQVGVALGLFAGIGGGACTLASGRIAQALTGRIGNPELWVAIVGLILSFPLISARRDQPQHPDRARRRRRRVHAHVRLDRAQLHHHPAAGSRAHARARLLDPGRGRGDHRPDLRPSAGRHSQRHLWADPRGRRPAGRLAVRLGHEPGRRGPVLRLQPDAEPR